MPVINLEKSDKAIPGSNIKIAFAIPAIHADIAIMVELLKISNRDSRLKESAPKTKPTCTPLVNHAAWDRLSDISRHNSGTIAVAEYHVVSDKTSATPVTTRTNQRFDNALDN
jgi:hypothetical protein